MSAIPSAWDTSGPSAIGAAFYGGRMVNGRGQTPNVSPRERKPSKVAKVRAVYVRADLDAMRAYIVAGHTLKQTAIRFGVSPRTITNNLGGIKTLRPAKKPGRKPPVRGYVKRAVYTTSEQWAYVLANGGTEFLRKLIDNARSNA